MAHSTFLLSGVYYPTSHFFFIKNPKWAYGRWAKRQIHGYKMKEAQNEQRKQDQNRAVHRKHEHRLLEPTLARTTPLWLRPRHQIFGLS